MKIAVEGRKIITNDMGNFRAVWEPGKFSSVKTGQEAEKNQI